MRRVGIGLLCLALIAAVVVAVATGGGPSGDRPARDDTAVPVYRLDTDHPTYGTLDELRGASEAVVTGTVLSQSVEDGVSPGNDPAGDPLPAVPQTNYTVRVDETFKGGAVVGSTIVVSLSGGTTQDGQFVLDGGPVLKLGDAYLFFLERGENDSFYPLAGGAAIADKKPDGSFVLPAESTGTEPLPLTKAAIAGRPSGGDPAPTGPTNPPPPPPTGPTASPPKCSIRPLSSRVLLRRPKGKSKAKPGRIEVSVRCDQRADVQIGGTIKITPKRTRGSKRPKARITALVPGTGSTTADMRLKLTVKVPRSALKALAGGASESVSLLLTARNSNGVVTATAAIKKLKPR